MASFQLIKILIKIIEFIGNSDGNINPGETIWLTLPIMNMGGTELSNISAELITNSNFITINNAISMYGFGYIPIGASMTNNSLFEIEIDPNASDYEDLGLKLIITDLIDNWQSDVNIDVNGSNIEIGNLIINGNDQFLNSNGSSYLTLVLNNLGRYTTDNLTGTITSLTAGLNVVTPLVNWENISAGASSSPNTTIEIEVMSGVINGTMATFELELISNTEFEQILTFNLQVGQVSVTDPLGPDNYGYYIYDSDDVEYDLAPLYNWNEIDPGYGGDGEDLNISDEELANKKIDYLDVGKINLIDEPEKELVEDIKNTPNLFYKSNKIIMSNKLKFSSYPKYKQNIQNTGKYESLDTSGRFFDDLDHYHIVKLLD